MHFSTSLIPFLLAVTAVVDARMQRKRCEDYPTSPNVPGKAIDFSTHNSSTHTPEEFLNQMRFKVSNFTVGAAAGSVPRIFEKKNVEIVDGALRLLVRGQEGRGTVSSGEIQSYDSYAYGTLETIAKATPVPGVCQCVPQSFSCHCPSSTHCGFAQRYIFLRVGHCRSRYRATLVLL